MICQHFYCPSIRITVQKEVHNYDTCQFTKQSNIEYGKLPFKSSDEIPWKNSVYI